MAQNKGTSGAIDGLVYDFFVLAVESILQERRASLKPITSSTYVDNSDYNRQALLPWKKDVNRLLILDLYILNPKNSRHILMERWKIHYARNNDSKDTRPFSIINRRILTFIRTIACFIRLLPGYSLINLCAARPVLNYKIFEAKADDSLNPFTNDTLKYKFNPISTSRGILSMGVTYINPSLMKDILRTISGTKGGESHTVDKPIPTQSEREKSAAIPIPSSGNSTGSQKSYSLSTSSANRHSHGLYGRAQQQRIDEYEDGGVSSGESSSHEESSGRHFQRLQPSHPSDDLRRRSFQLRDKEGGGVDGIAHQQAVSLDHYSKPSPPHQFPHSPAQTIGRAEDNSRVNNRITTPPMPMSGAHVHNHSRTYEVAGSQGASNASSHSSPPFSLMDHHRKQLEPPRTYPDPAKASPPYQQFSTSLVSTSPSVPSHMLSMLETFRKRQPSATPDGRLNALSMMQWKSPSAQPDSGIASDNAYKLTVALPRSPFLVGAANEARQRTDSELALQLPNITLDVVLHQERLQKQLPFGWGGAAPSEQLSLVDDFYSAESGHRLQFRDSNESGGPRLSGTALELEEDRDSGTQLEGEEEDGAAFAFALNPQEGLSQYELQQEPLSSLDRGGALALSAEDLLSSLNNQMQEFRAFSAQLNNHDNKLSWQRGQQGDENSA